MPRQCCFYVYVYNNLGWTRKSRLHGQDASVVGRGPEIFLPTAIFARMWAKAIKLLLFLVKFESRGTHNFLSRVTIPSELYMGGYNFA